MTFVSADKIIIAVQIVIVAAVTWGVLVLVRGYGGRPAFWLLGLTFFLLAGLALFRLRK
jgi:hypothetical protein